MIEAHVTESLLRCIEAPVVEELKIDADVAMWDEGTAWNGIIKILCVGSSGNAEPMFPNLKTLSLHSLSADPTHLGTLLTMHPTITFLTLNLNYINNDILGSLTSPILASQDARAMAPTWATKIRNMAQKPEPGGVNAWILPNLETLKAYGFTGDMLKGFVASRKAEVPLKTVLYADTCQMKIADRKWLRENLEKLEEFEDDENADDDDTDEEEED